MLTVTIATVDEVLKQAQTLKQELVDFVYDAEGEMAEALETYAAEQTRHRKLSQDMVVDIFLTEGSISDQTPLELFMQEQSDLTAGDRQLLQQWQRSFTGLFAIEQTAPDGFELMNWLTAKHYSVQLHPEQQAELLKLQSGEILLTRIAPLQGDRWMIFGPHTRLGKLGKPKLAVAIGNFKDNHRSSLYSDAPDLLEEAWQSVEKYHQSFVDFFGSDTITRSGYQLNKEISEFREVLAQQQLKAAGVDPSKSLEEIAAEAGIDEEEIAAAAEEAGVSPEEAAKMFAKQGSLAGKPKMMMPSVQIPEELKKAEQVTVLAHPRWGQMFLPNHHRFEAILTSPDWQTLEGSESVIRRYLEDPSINWYVWQQLAQQYPQQLEQVLQTFLNRPDFKLTQDLDPLLREHGKFSDPELPEIASVPIHLHDLFAEAVREVQKMKSKTNKRKPKKTGFGAGK